MDVESDGYITYQDIKTTLLKLGKNEEEIEEIFKNMEYENSDKIKYSDFISKYFYISCYFG